MQNLIAINFISYKHNNAEQVMHLKSDNIEKIL